MTVHKNRLIAYRVGDEMVVLQLKMTIEDKPPVDHHKGPACPCCEKPMGIAFDIQQMGFWDDEFWTYFACLDCGVAVAYEYRLSHVEPPKRKRGQKEKITS